MLSGPARQHWHHLTAHSQSRWDKREPSHGCDTEPTHLHTHTHPHVGQGRNVLAVTTASHKTSHHVTAMLTAQLSSSSSKMLPVSWLSSLPSLLVQSATAN